MTSPVSPEALDRYRCPDRAAQVGKRCQLSNRDRYLPHSVDVADGRGKESACSAV
jgi:hypothetical protein